MIVYHGSDTLVDAPRIFEANRPLDFGGGFYVTTSKEQAERWARKVAFRNASPDWYINIYEFDLESAIKSCKVIRFQTADEAWLDFICANRQGKYSGDYDIVMGPVADDRVYRVVVEYENGDMDKERAIKALRAEVLCNQILFHSDKALRFLKHTHTEVKHERA